MSRQASDHPPAACVAGERGVAVSRQASDQPGAAGVAGERLQPGTLRAMSASVGPIPVELCLSGRDLTEPRLDPSGRLLAFVSRSAGPASVTVVDLDADGLERQLSLGPPPAPGRGLGGGCLAWRPDGLAIAYAATDGEIWEQALDGSGRRLTSVRSADRAGVEGSEPAPAARSAMAPDWAPDGQAVAYQIDDAEIWVQPLGGGPAQRVDDGDAFCFDPRFAPDGRSVAYQGWSPPDMAWDGAAIVVVPIGGDGAVASPATRPVPGDHAAQQPRWTADGWLVDVDDRSGWLNVTIGGQPIVAGGDPHEHAGPTWGPGQASFALSPDGSHVAVARNDAGFGLLSVIDVDTGAITDVARGVHGALSWRGSRLAALRTGARTPTQIVVYDTGAWSRRVVAIGPAAGWDAVGAAGGLPEPDVVAADADGATVWGRCYPGQGRRRGLMVCVHGGPTDQWMVTFQPRITFWTSRGWDVLVVDHRGTTGHGRAYQQALHGGWGEIDVRDTVALVEAVQADRGIDAAHTVINGGSAGGMTVLGVLLDAPQCVAGGIAAYPVTDLVELADRSHRFEAHYTDTLVAPRRDEQALQMRSPLRRAGELTRPFVIFHGEDDPVVPVEGSIVFAATARDAGADVELHLFEGEGHGFRQPQHKRAEYERSEAFVDRVVPPAS